MSDRFTDRYHRRGMMGFISALTSFLGLGFNPAVGSKRSPVLPKFKPARYPNGFNKTQENERFDRQCKKGWHRTMKRLGDL